MSKATTIASIRAELWRSRLGSALRTTLACTIVGCTSLYGPASLKRYITFPAYSYVTTILIVSDATLGDTLRGCCHVLCATLQVMFITMLSLHLIGPPNFTNHVAAAAVAVGSFLVALVESTHLMTKRIAFGQLVIIYVSTVIHGGKEGVIMHPFHVASSTALGSLASVVAMLLPYPRLGYLEARKFYRLYIENACERLNCNIETISASDNSTAVGFFNQAKSFSTVGAKLFQSIKSNLDGIHWERPLVRIFNPHCIVPEERVQNLEIALRGMDIALSSYTSFPVTSISEELRGSLLNCKGQLKKKLNKQARCIAPFHAINKENLNNNLSIACKDLPTSFFLYCSQLLLDDSSIVKKKEKSQKSGDDSKWNYTRKIFQEVVMNLMPRTNNFTFAFKCSFSLGLAVLLGLTYNKENGYWSGLTIAITFVTGHQPTFSVANARGQGTAMGSIYGVLCSFIFQSFVDLRFLSLLPWIVFTSFLRHSRMYGQAGGISAVIGALLILGRKLQNDPPSQFAVTRIVEATIGLICFIIVEILSCPKRAATLAKSQLSQSLKALQDCIEGMQISNSQELRVRQKKLKSLVFQLQEFIEEALLEPNFWFLPFHHGCYSNMMNSLSRMVDLLLFVAYSMEHIMLLSRKDGVFWMDLQDNVNKNMEIFKKKISPALKCLEELTKIESIKELEKELKNRNLPCDSESGEYPNADAYRIFLCGDEEVDTITSSFLQHMEEMVHKTHSDRDEEIMKGQVIFHYSCLVFCIRGLMRETMNIESEVKELLIWENPSSQANLKEIYCKISVLAENLPP